MSAMLRIAVILAAAMASLASFGPGDPDPEPDSCDSPEAGSIDTIDVGQSLDDDVFESLADGSVINFIFGGQGSPMLPVRYRINGSDLPECASHRTTVTYCGAFDEPNCQPLRETSLVTPLNTYVEDDGSRSTKRLFVIMGTPADRMPLELEVQIGDAIANRTFYVSGLPTDASPDAEIAADANVSDAETDAAGDAATSDAN